MPKQRKQRRRRQRESAADAGRWEVVFETQDAAALRAQLVRLRGGDAPVDVSTVRVDTLCGRSTRPTTYRLSRFVRDPGS
ncbi:hypothetical protein ACH4TX_43715 [Streptomyces sp. NPDC021098]|uniref:hypothetical protein n=1 Tax=unclassified Streptomyces TaxID=2593676 RepID=UPI003793CE68